MDNSTGIFNENPDANLAVVSLDDVEDALAAVQTTGITETEMDVTNVSQPHPQPSGDIETHMVDDSAMIQNAGNHEPVDKAPENEEDEEDIDDESFESHATSSSEGEEENDEEEEEADEGAEKGQAQNGQKEVSGSGNKDTASKIRLRRSRRRNFGNRYDNVLKNEQDEAGAASKRTALLMASDDFDENDDSSSDDDAEFNPNNQKNDSGSDDDDDDSASEASHGSASTVEDKTETKTEETTSGKVPRSRDALYSAFDAKKSLDDLLNEVADSHRLEGLAICSICLWDENDPETDAVIQCDSCGVSVHEACYGVVGKELEELHESAKVEDSKSTEDTMPWFCDACRFGEQNPSCVLCPNKYGAFKQTIKGEWVHSACARYAKEVYFDDDVRLTDVVIADVPHSRFGDHSCIICPDMYRKNAGITLKCETGMCRKFLHVTCAMLVGTAVEMEQELGFPYAIYCPDHIAKDDRAGNRRCFLAALGLQRKHQKYLEKLDPLEKGKLDSAAQVQRNAYLEQRKQRVIQKFTPSVRPLYAVYELVSIGQERAAALGMDSQPIVNPNPSIEAAKLTKPEFRPEFVAYIYRREALISEYLEALKKAKTERDDFAKVNLSAMKAEWNQVVPYLKTEKDNIRKLLRPFFPFIDIKPPVEPTVNGSRSNGARKAKLEDLLRRPEQKAPKEARCATCASMGMVEKMAKCDECRGCYHLKCLDPPLPTVPNKRGVRWLCSNCAPSEDDDDEEGSEESSDTVEGRKKRRLQGQNPNREKQNQIGEPTPSKGKRGRKVGFRPAKKPKTEVESGMTNATGSTAATSNGIPSSFSGGSGTAIKIESEQAAGNGKGETSSRQTAQKGRKRKVEDEGSGTCIVCKKEGDSKSAVQCETCGDWYHFATCLDPPCTKSPKSRFYGWQCEKCNESEEPVEEEEDEED